MIGKPPSAESKREKLEARSRNRDEKAAFRRQRMREVMEHFGLSQTDWCEKAGLDNTSALGNFLIARQNSPKSLHLDTLEPLAKAVGLTVSELIGELPFPWEGVSISTVSGALNKYTFVIDAPDGVRVTIETNNPQELLQSILKRSAAG